MQSNIAFPPDVPLRYPDRQIDLTYTLTRKFSASELAGKLNCFEISLKKIDIKNDSSNGIE